MFSVEEEDIEFSDDEINFSLLQTGIPYGTKKISPKAKKQEYIENADNMITPKKQLDDTRNSPTPKRFKFQKAPNLHTYSTTSVVSSFHKNKNEDDFFTNDDDDDLLSKVEMPTTATKPKSSFERMSQNSNQHILGADDSSELEIPGTRNCRLTTLKNMIYKLPQPISLPSTKGSRNLIRTIIQAESPKQIGIKKSNDTPSRKFPGPAGNLPQLDNYAEINKLRSPEICKEKKSLTPQRPNTPIQNVINSQDSALHSEVWTEIQKFVKRKFSGEEVYSISDVLAKASHKTLYNCKVPLVCGIIKSFSLIGSSGRLVLQDSSGEINGALHSDILDEYENGLQKGSGIVLKDVSVFSPTSKKHYLNITPSNIAVFLESSLQDEQLTQFTQISNSTIILDSSNRGQNF